MGHRVRHQLGSFVPVLNQAVLNQAALKPESCLSRLRAPLDGRFGFVAPVARRCSEKKKGLSKEAF
jgi:hypothetical protein